MGRADGGARGRLHALAVGRANALPAEQARRWLSWHGLHCLADDERLRPELRAHLAERRETTRVQNRWLIWRWQDVVEVVEGALGPGRVCPLKGIHLLDLLYGDELGDRPMCDLDLLVAPADFGAIVALLEERFGLSQSASWRRRGRVHHHRVLVGPNVQIEVHRALSFRHARCSTWNNLALASGTLFEREVPLLGRADTMVHLLTHFVRHGPFAVWKWVEDIVRLAELGVDGALVAERARALGAAPSVSAALRAIERVLGVAALGGAEGARLAPRTWGAVINDRVVWRHLRQGRGPNEADASATWRLTASAILLASTPGEALVVARDKARERWLR